VRYFTDVILALRLCIKYSQVNLESKQLVRSAAQLAGQITYKPSKLGQADLVN